MRSGDFTPAPTASEDQQDAGARPSHPQRPIPPHRPHGGGTAVASEAASAPSHGRGAGHIRQHPTHAAAVQPPAGRDTSDPAPSPRGVAPELTAVAQTMERVARFCAQKRAEMEAEERAHTAPLPPPSPAIADAPTTMYDYRDGMLYESGSDADDSPSVSTAPHAGRSFHRFLRPVVPLADEVRRRAECEERSRARLLPAESVRRRGSVPTPGVQTLSPFPPLLFGAKSGGGGLSSGSLSRHNASGSVEHSFQRHHVDIFESSYNSSGSPRPKQTETGAMEGDGYVPLQSILYGSRSHNQTPVGSMVNAGYVAAWAESSPRGSAPLMNSAEMGGSANQNNSEEPTGRGTRKRTVSFTGIIYI
ncbi:hypothetical protein STCU_09914 [Strigomonas culicis]|uniref:Uncharacterized protein n=1 Tax=Strigomonas culicis TaxID=28005 RepID=S9TP02_9TRYP|nr:hypothetical protein STCU_09914 [Strigomonas culicis]|eukprot:EPY18434.1 hypothetical protein STCU_09914 [Strigomonas culicis]